LVWDKAARHYTWHVVVDDGVVPTPTTATGIAGVDLGEIHPAAMTDGVSAAVVSCRALRSNTQYTNKRVSVLCSKQDHLVKGSSRWKRLQRRKNRFLAQQKRRERDLVHKASRAVIGWAQDNGVGTLAIGNVRDVADGKRLNKVAQQKVSQWPHGLMRRYLGYKAEAAGIGVDDEVDEAYTTKTCPQCGARTKPKGRVYACHACGFRGVRDTVGAANILSRYQYGELGRVMPPAQTTYLRPLFARRATDGVVARTRPTWLGCCVSTSRSRALQGQRSVMNYQQARSVAAKVRKTIPTDQKTVFYKDSASGQWGVRVEDVCTGRAIRYYGGMDAEATAAV
jgi:IS605 OrfB family transposase